MSKHKLSANARAVQATLLRAILANLELGNVTAAHGQAQHYTEVYGAGEHAQWFAAIADARAALQNAIRRGKGAA